MFDPLQASGFTHFQQSGTGAIRKYYNYVRVTPMVQPLDDLGEAWALHDEVAAAGYYAATLDTGVRCEITVGEKVAVHRYTFPEQPQRPGGGRPVLRRARHRARPHGAAAGPGREHGPRPRAGHGGAWRAFRCRCYLEVDSPGWRQMLWYDRRLIEGGTRLDFDSIRQTTLRPFGLLFMGPARAGADRRGAAGLLAARLRPGPREPGARVRRAPSRRSTRSGPAPRARWADHLDRVQVDGGTPGAAAR